MKRFVTPVRAGALTTAAICLLVGFNSPAKASSGPAGPSSGADSSASTMDPQLMATQERLLSFRTWIENVPGILDSGYFDTSIDVRQLAVTVVWNGTSPLLDLVKKEGLGR
jgi:hypothetical protein